MIKKRGYLFFCAIMMTSLGIIAQDRGSAALLLEEYTDDFHNYFFEALKEKAIENHQKAIHLLLECKKLESGDKAVDYELGKNHFALQQYDEAIFYFKNAMAKDPDNRWYLDALFKTYLIQNVTDKAIVLGKRLAQKHHRYYKEQLITLYIQDKKYGEAIQLLDELDDIYGTSATRRKQRDRYARLLTDQDNTQKKGAKKNIPQYHNPLYQIDAKIATYQKSFDYKNLLIYIEEILEYYPSQSRFYYIKGKALNELKRHKEAVSFLEVALAFLIDGDTVANTIYSELALAYQALGNNNKAQQYTKKIKKGV